MSNLPKGPAEDISPEDISPKEFVWKFEKGSPKFSPSLEEFTVKNYTPEEAGVLVKQFQLFYHELGGHMLSAQGERLLFLTGVYQLLAAANNYVLGLAGNDYKGLALCELSGLEILDATDKNNVAEVAYQVAGLLPQIFAQNDNPKLIPCSEHEFDSNKLIWVLPSLEKYPQALYFSQKMADNIIGKLREVNEFLNTNLEYFIYEQGGPKMAKYYNHLVKAFNHVRNFTNNKPKPMLVIGIDDLARIANLNVDGQNLTEYFKRLMIERGN